MDSLVFNSNMDSSTPVVVFSVIATRCVVKPAEFDVARNVLDLINAQTLAWIGVYFSPLLPVVQLIKLFLIFHLKKTSIRSCHPPSSWSRVGQMQTLFISLLFLPCYLGTLALLAYTLWSLPPSSVCGPFQGQGWVMQTVDRWIASVQASQPHSAWLAWIINVILHSQVFYCLLTLIVLVVMYFLWQVTQGRKRLIMSLREQIVNEGKDKAFLLKRLQCLQRQGAGRPRPQVHFEEEKPTRPESGQLREEARPPPSFQHPSPPMEAPSVFTRPPWDSSPRLGRAQPPAPWWSQPQRQPWSPPDPSQQAGVLGRGGATSPSPSRSTVASQG
ncbi:transmembrane channel-like protein 5 [Oncorhynchus keta]|uniref:transmembrane channel-like protein 5 n=1 Tax=Oncorhynchus keta TaxID=8018 RepID=UPI00227B68D7|nr:transmembrane channel-like protein 5 [Oncorhynchus keta]